jgi:voltage-gated potassium channel
MHHMNLVLELAVATALVVLSVFIHLGGIALLLALLRRHRGKPDTRTLWHEGMAILGAAGGLFVLHALEIWLYAAFYLMVGALSGLEAALYFSTSSYTTVGYGDVVLDERWRLIGAIEGANGLILLGWSTAFFVAIVGRIRGLESEVEAMA